MQKCTFSGISSVSPLCHFSYVTLKNVILFYKMRSIFPIFKNFQGISPDFNPKNGHPSCHLGFDSSDVEARRGSTSLDLVEPRLEAGTPLIIYTFLPTGVNPNTIMYLEA